MLHQTISVSPGNSKAHLKTYILNDSPQYHTGLCRPAVLIMPGGGYSHTSDREAEFIALEFAAMGYHAFVLRYSVGEKAVVPEPLLEGFRAISIIRENAKEWRVDPERIVLCGFSAGGHLAAGLMTMWKDKEILEKLQLPPERLRPTAGILCYALLRLPYKLESVDTGFPAGERDALINLIEGEFPEPQHPDWMQAVFEKNGTLWVDNVKIAYLNCFQTESPSQEQLLQANMICKVEGDTPPAFIWTTTTDEMVPAEHSVAFANAMLQKGRPVELHLFGSGGHGLSLNKPTTNNEDESRYPAGRWLGLAEAWLRELLKDPGAARGTPFAQGEAENNCALDDSESGEKPPQYYANIYNDRAGMFCHSPFSLEQQLVLSVMDGDEKAALDMLGQINRQGSKAVLAKEPLRSAKNSIICSCTFLTRAAIQAGVPDEEAFALSDAVIQHIETLTVQKDVLSYEESMLVQVIRLVKKYRGKSYSTPVRRALHYIDSHLEKNIQLSDVAEYAKVHPNHLSKRFRQETGSTLTGYTAARKIHEASYFVLHTNYPMAEIASLYGFSSQSYFIHSFKKVMGMPPGEYRNHRSIMLFKESGS